MNWLSFLGLGKKIAGPEFPVEFDQGDKRIVGHVLAKNLSMTSRERLYATAMACRHVVTAGVKGDFVELGVWRGGHALIAADIFKRAGSDAQIYLFDTFAGMTAPTECDFDNREHKRAQERYDSEQRSRHNEWCNASLEDVRNNFRQAGLLGGNVKMIQGDVLETLSQEENLPETISVLRLDTDWYQSTRKELEVLWPRLQPGGILMIDDYGHWSGAKKATDEFFASRPRPFFHYIDYTGRLAVKA